MDWMDEWMIFDPGNWHLKDGAPDDVKKAFKDYMKEDAKVVKARTFNECLRGE
jgi:hypothetical protein